MADQTKVYYVYEGDITEHNQVILRSEMGTVTEKELDDLRLMLSNYILEINYQRWDDDCSCHDECASRDNLPFYGTKFFSFCTDNPSYMLRVNGIFKGVVFQLYDGDEVTLYPFLFLGERNNMTMTMAYVSGRNRYYKTVYGISLIYNRDGCELDPAELTPAPFSMPCCNNGF